MTDAAITTICSAAGLGLTFAITEFFKYRRELMLREQNRKDREADRASLEQVAKAATESVEKGEVRKQEILTKVDEGIKATEQFAKTANDVNAKIAHIGLEIKAKQEGVQDVHIVNAASDPIPVDPVKPL